MCHFVPIFLILFNDNFRKLYIMYNIFKNKFWVGKEDMA
jgi:hypothetical protein